MPTWFPALFWETCCLTALISGLLTNQLANQVAVRHSVNWVMSPRQKRTKKFPQRCYKWEWYNRTTPLQKIIVGHLNEKFTGNPGNLQICFWKANHFQFCLLSRPKLRFRTTMRLSRLEMMTVTFNCVCLTNLPGMFHMKTFKKSRCNQDKALRKVVNQHLSLRAP